MHNFQSGFNRVMAAGRVKVAFDPFGTEKRKRDAAIGSALGATIPIPGATMLGSQLGGGGWPAAFGASGGGIAGALGGAGLGGAVTGRRAPLAALLGAMGGAGLGGYHFTE